MGFIIRARYTAHIYHREISRHYLTATSLNHWFYCRGESIFVWNMSDSDTTDEAIRRVRDAFETAEEEAEELSEAARQEVTDAIDDLEAHIDKLRERE